MCIWTNLWPKLWNMFCIDAQQSNWPCSPFDNIWTRATCSASVTPRAVERSSRPADSVSQRPGPRAVLSCQGVEFQCNGRFLCGSAGWYRSAYRSSSKRSKGCILRKTNLSKKTCTVSHQFFLGLLSFRWNAWLTEEQIVLQPLTALSAKEVFGSNGIFSWRKVWFPCFVWAIKERRNIRELIEFFWRIWRPWRTRSWSPGQSGSLVIKLRGGENWPSATATWRSGLRSGWGGMRKRWPKPTEGRWTQPASVKELTAGHEELQMDSKQSLLRGPTVWEGESCLEWRKSQKSKIQVWFYVNNMSGWLLKTAEEVLSCAAQSVLCSGSWASMWRGAGLCLSKHR